MPRRLPHASPPLAAQAARPLFKSAAQRTRRPLRTPQLSQGSWYQLLAWVLGLGGLGLGILVGGWLGALVAVVLIVGAILLGLTGSFLNGNMP
ncbi:hypothetical protein [Hymenobacter coalescens]